MLTAGRPRDGAPAGCEDDVGEQRELRDHGFLAVAKSGLAFDLEDGRDRHAAARLELVVGVEKALAQAAGELAAERRLAGAHQSDQKQIAAMKRHRGILRRSASLQSRESLWGNHPSRFVNGSR